MVAYSDVPKVNALYDEQARVRNGIAMLDAGGSIGSFVVVPPPHDAADPMGHAPMMMAATIFTIDPPAELVTAAHDAMVARDLDITAELTALGVTADPPA